MIAACSRYCIYSETAIGKTNHYLTSMLVMLELNDRLEVIVDGFTHESGGLIANLFKLLGLKIRVYKTIIGSL